MEARGGRARLPASGRRNEMVPAEVKPGGAWVGSRAPVRFSVRPLDLVSVLFAAAFSILALAAGTAGADEGLVPGAEGLPAPLLGGPGKVPLSFRLPDSAFAFEAGVSEYFQEDPPQRFSLFPGASASDARDRPATGWGPPRPPFSGPAQPPVDVLRGVRNSSSPYATKFLRGTLIVTGTELVSGAVLALLPSQYTKWDDAALQRGSSNFKRAWTTPPVWDGDVFFHNWLGHPYAGALYYNMIRSQGGTVWQSVGFNTFQTFMWEYVIEAVAEQPSIQDLITTPVLGSLLGELFHTWSIAILRSGPLNLGEKALVFFLNPSYVINNGFRVPE